MRTSAPSAVVAATAAKKPKEQKVDEHVDGIEVSITRLHTSSLCADATALAGKVCPTLK